MLKRLGSIGITVFLAAAFFMSITTKQAHAYIDFGAGSMVLQVLVASFFASLFSIKLFWRRMTDSVARFYSKIKKPKGVGK